MHGRPEATGAAPLGAQRSAPGARCRVRRCPGSVPPSTSPLFEPPRLCLCLCPPLPGCACRLSAPPPPQDARGARPGAALAAGRAEGVGSAGGGGRGRGAGARASGPAVEAPRRSVGERRRLGGGGVEREAGAGTRSCGAERGTGVTEAGLRRAGLGTRRAGRGRSVPPTPDAQPALSAPTYPRERPAGDIPTPPPPPAPTPPSGERSFTTTHGYTKTQKSARTCTRASRTTRTPAAHSPASRCCTCDC